MRLSFVLNLLLLLVSVSLQQAWAQVVAPSRGGYVRLDAATATTLRLSFSGKGQGRVVAVAVSKRAMPVPLAAANNTFYTGDATYSKGSVLGKGYAVYAGTGNSILVTGLQPDTDYYVTDSEYNTDDKEIVYNTQGTSIIATTLSTPQVVTPLPVELVSFTGAVSATNQVTLRWSTATERNSNYFAVECSANNQEFVEVGRVDAAGSSFQLLAYTWVAPQRLTALNYYRLRQVDLDLSVHYSNVVALSPRATLPRTIEVYPNPGASQNVEVALQGFDGETISLRIFDNIGRMVFAKVLTPTSAALSLPLQLPQSLAAGTYIAAFTSVGSYVQKRLVVVD